MQIANARHRLRLQQPQQLPHIFTGLEGELSLWWPVGACPDRVGRRVLPYLPIEINQQRLIAGKLESRATSRRQVHSRESIPHTAAPLTREAFLGVSAKARTLARDREGIRVRVSYARAMRRARTQGAIQQGGLA